MCLKLKESIETYYNLIGEEDDSNMLNDAHYNLINKPIRRRRRNQNKNKERSTGNSFSSNQTTQSQASTSPSEQTTNTQPIQMFTIPSNQSWNVELHTINAASNQSLNNVISFNTIAYLSQQDDSNIQINAVDAPISNNNNNLTYDTSRSLGYNILENDVQVLTVDEENLLNSINAAYDCAIRSVEQKPQSDSSINALAIPSHLLVSFFTSNQDFSSLSRQTKINLMKSSIMEILLIHDAVLYDPKSESFHNMSTTSACLFEFCSTSNKYTQEIYQCMMNVAKNLFALCNGNISMIKLVFFLSIFKVGNQGESEIETAKLQSLNIKYTNILYKYILQSRLANPNSILREIFCLIDELKPLAIKSQQIIVENSKSVIVDGLMADLFSIPIPILS